MDAICYDADFETFLRGWVKDCEDCNKDLRLYTGVDTGATNTRVAIGNDISFKTIANFKCKSTRVLVACLHEIAEKVNEVLDCKQFIKAGCLDAAGRVSDFGEFVEITNYELTDDNKQRELHLSELPTLLFPEGHRRIINDLESACYGISGLNSRTEVNDFFKILLGPNDEQQTRKLNFEHYLVIAVGTGMGVGLLMALPGQKDFVVLPLEGGHVLLSGSPLMHCRKNEESRMLEFISNDIYDCEHSLEYEDLVSGRGLESLYKFFAHESEDETIPAELNAEDVSASALKGEEIASKALLYHYLYLARGSANLAICMGAKGIIWAGGNQISNGCFVDENRCSLYSEFLHHPKQPWLKPLPIYVQTKEFNVNLEGTLHVSRAILSE